MSNTTDDGLRTSTSSDGATATSPLAAGMRNRLLRAIPHEELEVLLPHLEPWQLEPMQLIVERGATIAHVHFPHTGIVSILSRLDDGTLIENGTIGFEGMSAFQLALGVDWSQSLIVGQVPGSSHRVAASTFKELLPTLPTLRALLQRYAVYFLAQVSQSLACNSLHTVDQRCARWLLMTDDRKAGSEFVLTHEVLSQMLAVRRAGVSEAASDLQRKGLIKYSRGRVAVIDRAGLERESCECYRKIRSHRDQLLGHFDG